MRSNVTLFVNDVAVDLAPGAVLALTRQVNDIAELKNRSADYSNAFKLPASSKNKKLFNGAQVVESVTREAYRKLPAKLLMNGAESPGVLVLMSANQKEFNCVFYAGNYNFFTAIQGKKLKDLDLSFAEHAWTFANVVASRNNEWNSGGYVYPFVDTVNDGVNFNNGISACEWRWLTPWLFAKTIWNQIFLEAGFEYTGKFLNSVRFENVLTNLVTNQPQLGYIQFEIDRNAAILFPAVALLGYIEYMVQFNNVVVDTIGQAQTKVGISVFQPAYPGKYSFELNLNVETVHYNKLRYVDILAVEDTTPVASAERRIAKRFVAGTDFNSFHINVKASDIFIDSTEFVFVRFTFFPLDGSYINQFELSTGSNLKVTKYEYANIFNGQTWKIQENLYDMEQSEFIKQICQRFCLIPDSETNFNRVDFFQFGELVDNIPIAKDYSDKTLEGTAIEFHDNSYAQNNLMKWARPEELPDADTTYGDGTFTIDDTTLTQLKTILELKFKASRMVKRFNSRFIPHIQYHNEDAPVVGEWENVGARLLQLDRSDDHRNVNVVDLANATFVTVSTNVPMCYFQSFVSQTDLTFSNAMLNDYYDLIRALKNYKKLSEMMDLNSSEVTTHKFKIPVYLRKYNSYFAVLQITNFVSGKPVALQLLKLN